MKSLTEPPESKQRNEGLFNRLINDQIASIKYKITNRAEAVTARLIVN